MIQNSKLFCKRLVAWSVWSLLLFDSKGISDPKIGLSHPRIFIHKQDVQRIKNRINSDPGIKKAYGMVRKFAYGSSMQSNLWVAPQELCSVLLAYIVEDRDPGLLKRARVYLDFFDRAEGDSWTQPLMLKAIAIAYDWLYEDLDLGERKKCADRMVALVEKIKSRYRHSDYNNHVYLEYGPILYAALALAKDGIADNFARRTLLECELRLKEHFIPAVNQVGGDGSGGWQESMGYWSFFAYEFAQQLEAWRTATGEALFKKCNGLRGAANWFIYCTRPNDKSMAPVADINTPSPWGWQETELFPLIAARYHDGIAQLAAKRIPPVYPAHAWSYVLWFDPSIKPVPLRSFPRGTLFPGVGWAAMRSSWKPDATWALFVCGDYYSGHQHCDQNSFIISHKGNLAIDAGEYGAKASLFHNTVLIGGDQRCYKNDPRQFVAPTKKDSEFDTGDILAYEENHLFTYVVGDASNAYGRFKNGRRIEKPPVFLRRFIFLKPSTFVIDDRVQAATPQASLKWLLHSLEKPVIKNRQIMIIDNWGELFCESLLPEKVTIKNSRQTGGKKNNSFFQIEENGGPGKTRFLHVLHAYDRGSLGPGIQTELKKTGAGFELIISADKKIYRLDLFQKILRGGYISVSRENGETLLPRRLLPSGILPYSPSGIKMIERWDRAYQNNRHPPWDTGRPAKELVKLINDEKVKMKKGGRVIVLGCGTGTNAIFLAECGFHVTGVEIAPTALSRAEKKAVKAGVKVDWVLSDVLALGDLGKFDFIFDRGCYHGVRKTNAAGYVKTVCNISHPGTLFLLIAGNANEKKPHYGPPRVKEKELRDDFSSYFIFDRLKVIRFNDAGGTAKGALGWSVLIRRKG